MNKSITNILQTLVLQLLSITLTTVSMDSPSPHIAKVKINPNFIQAYYASAEIRDIAKDMNLPARQNEPFIPCLVKLPSCSKEKLITAEKDIKERFPNISRLELEHVLSQLENSSPKPLFLPLYSLRNKKHGDIITANSRLQLVYHNTDKHQFTNHVNAHMQQFKNNAQIMCVYNTPAEVQPLIDAEVTTTLGGTGHGPCGWFAPITEEKKASPDQIFPAIEKAAPRK